MRSLFSTLALASYALAAQKPSVIYLTLSSTQPSVSVVYVTVGSPLLATPSSVSSETSVPSEPVASSTGRYTIETYRVPYETGITIDSGDSGTPPASTETSSTDDASATDTVSSTALDSLTASGSALAQTSSETAAVTVTVTETVTASNTADPTPTSTSIYLPQFTTSSRRHRFF